jgi:predicted RecB family nuclease
VDWKTGQHLPRAQALAKRLQTIVYRYVLARGGAVWNGNQPLVPEQIEMVYWYAEHDGEERRFGYDAAQFAADEAYLLGLVEEIQSRAEFPLTADEKRCRFCVYRSLCERGREAGALAEWDAGYEADDSGDFDLDLDQIAEIEY